MLYIIFAIFLGVAILGVATGICLVRLQNWARTSALVWGGVSFVYGAFGLLVIPHVQLPPNPTPGASPVLRWLILFYFALQFFVGVWWLILFNRTATILQFANRATPAEADLPQEPG